MMSIFAHKLFIKDTSMQVNCNNYAQVIIEPCPVGELLAFMYATGNNFQQSSSDNEFPTLTNNRTL